MGRKQSPAAGRFARAVSAEIRAAMGRKRISGMELGNAPSIGRSQNYIAKRLRDELPFDLEDLDRVCAYLGIDLPAMIRKVNDDLAGRMNAGDDDG